MNNIDKIRKELSAERRDKIEARAAELIAEEMSLRELRRAHKLTQERIAEALGIGQDQVSRLEQRSDLLISTLRSYIEAMGGHLTLIAEFPNHRPVVLSGIGSIGTEPSRQRARVADARRMSSITEAIREQLMASDPEYQRLREENASYAAQLKQLVSKQFLNEQEQVDEVRLKKLKSRAKDRMQMIVRREQSV
jgi:transcriptional regulator with XRE-family HTH domain